MFNFFSPSLTLILHFKTMTRCCSFGWGYLGSCWIRRDARRPTKAPCARSTTPFVTDARLESGDGSLLSHRRGGGRGLGRGPAVRPGEKAAYVFFFLSRWISQVRWDRNSEVRLDLLNIKRNCVWTLLAVMWETKSSCCFNEQLACCGTAT